MDLGIRNKVALVCGASKGIGRACAEALAAEGVRLAICARGEGALTEAAEGMAASPPVAPIPCDLCDPEAIEALVQRVNHQLGPIAILVTNTGGPPAGRFTRFDREDWECAVQQNLLSVQTLCRAALPHMLDQKWGRIINLVSVAAKQPIPNLVLSNSLRAAVIGLAKTLADEVAADGVTVNNVCPGFIWTERSRTLIEARAADQGVPFDQARAQLESAIPTGRIGQPEDVAALVAFLASEQASYITGATVQVDGGLYRGLM